MRLVKIMVVLSCLSSIFRSRSFHSRSPTLTSSRSYTLLVMLCLKTCLLVYILSFDWFFLSSSAGLLATTSKFVLTNIEVFISRILLFKLQGFPSCLISWLLRCSRKHTKLANNLRDTDLSQRLLVGFHALLLLYAWFRRAESKAQSTLTECIWVESHDFQAAPLDVILQDYLSTFLCFRVYLWTV